MYAIVIYIHRKELLLKADKSDPDLQLLLKLIDLLASCSEGENSFIKSMCHNIMEISELLQVVINNDWKFYHD